MKNSKDSFFKWEDKYKLEVFQMDKEHQRLIAIMNDLYEMNRDKVEFSALSLKLDELNKFTVSHFQNEEKFFSALPYEKAETHKNIHSMLLNKLRNHTEKMKKEKKLSEEYFDFLKVWLSAHIVGIDQGYASAARK